MDGWICLVWWELKLVVRWIHLGPVGRRRQTIAREVESGGEAGGTGASVLPCCGGARGRCAARWGGGGDVGLGGMAVDGAARRRWRMQAGRRGGACRGDGPWTGIFLYYISIYIFFRSPSVGKG